MDSINSFDFRTLRPAFRLRLARDLSHWSQALTATKLVQGLAPPSSLEVPRVTADNIHDKS